MRTFKVVAVEKPSLIEEQAGAEAKVILSEDDLIAKDERAAAFIAGTKLIQKGDKKVRMSLVDIEVIPFGS